MAFSSISWVFSLKISGKKQSITIQILLFRLHTFLAEVVRRSYLKIQTI